MASGNRGLTAFGVSGDTYDAKTFPITGDCLRRFVFSPTYTIIVSAETVVCTSSYIKQEDLHEPIQPTPGAAVIFNLTALVILVLSSLAFLAVITVVVLSLASKGDSSSND